LVSTLGDETPEAITIFSKTSSSLDKKRQFSGKFFGENILKIITLVPDLKKQMVSLRLNQIQFKLIVGPDSPLFGPLFRLD
jgi:hypothetical protein